MGSRVCVVTAGHLSTCPRMLKAADALGQAGHRVRVVSTRHVGWASAADAEVSRRRAGEWEWTVVDYARESARALYLWSGARHRAAQAATGVVGASRLPLYWAARAYGRVHAELLSAALSAPADLFYGGTTGALAAVAEAGRRAGVPYALDLEDFHSAEQDPGPRAQLAHALAARIEAAVLPGAAFLTASSHAISEAYAERYGVRPTVVHNTFPLPRREPDLAPNLAEGLRLYWFSQTIGPRRGLEEVIRAMGLAGCSGELHLRGRALPGYMESLERLAQGAAPRLTLVPHEPAPPDAMIELCARYDAGLSLEQGHVKSRGLCLTNKAFTYMLAGLAVVLTDTPGQRPLASDMGEGALLYAPGDAVALAAGLKRWAEDKRLLARARAAAWRAARRRWHWEHGEERGALLGAVAEALR